MPHRIRIVTNNIRYLLAHHPGFNILTFILFLIVLVNIKPQFSLLGWDNYSSYFEPFINIPRTIFATWRAYRGLGVPSDSESVDLFRQLFALILRPFIGEALVDQVYMLTALIAGVLLMYVFVYRLLRLRDRRKEHDVLFHRDIAAAIAGFFYLCNLNTLATFFFPIMPYINRFFAIPFLFLAALTMFENRRVSVPWFIALVVGMFFASGAYLTATIVITMLMSLGVYALVAGHLRRAFVFFLFFVGMNMFWLLPFANYTLQKSSIIRLAPTFVDTNEIQLNKSSASFGLSKQLTLFPNFFETTHTDSRTNTQRSFHPLSATIQTPVVQAILFFLPLGAALGALLIMVRGEKRLFWIPVVLGMYLFLTLKEYSPLGFLYQFFNDLSPYFGVLFRFGDTKFHPYLAFAASIACGYAVHLLLGVAQRKKWVHAGVGIVLIAGIVLPTLLVYRSYMEGQLLSPLLYNRIPPAYREIAAHINADTRFGRVLHLPFDDVAYWKSYSWGYLGSSFFHFLINKPFIDKTFEPGSMENAYVHERISALFANIQEVQGEGKQERAKALASVLQRVGVRYIILDETVQADVPVRQAIFWGTFHLAEVVTAVDALVAEGKAHIVSEYRVPGEKQGQSIRLVELTSEVAPVRAVPDAHAIDTGLDNVFTADIPSSSVIIQERNARGASVFPFARKNGVVTRDRAVVSLTLPDVAMEGAYTIPGISLGIENTRAIDISAMVKGEQLTFIFYELLYPTINGQHFNQKIGELSVPLRDVAAALSTRDSVQHTMSDWGSMGHSISALRLSINDFIVPVPVGIPNQETHVASTLITKTSLAVNVLVPQSVQPVSLSNFRLTDDPNCFQDKDKEYTYEGRVVGNGVSLKNRNGSVCMTGAIPDSGGLGAYKEISLRVAGVSEDGDARENGLPGGSLFRGIQALPKPTLLRLCVRGGMLPECLNTHDVAEVGGDRSLRIPVGAGMRGNLALDVTLLASAWQRASAMVSDVRMHTYRSTVLKTFSLPASLPPVTISHPAQTMVVEFPVFLSPFSYIYQPGHDGLYHANKPCPGHTYRTSRHGTDGWISAVQNCYNEVFASVPFDSSQSLFWFIRYHLFSGKYPKFMVSDAFTSYTNEYVSLAQGYPDIIGFKDLQTPKDRSVLSTEALLTRLRTAPSVYAYTMVGGQQDLGDTRPKQFIIHQDSENEGVFRLDEYAVVPLPTHWKSMQITGAEAQVQYAVPRIQSVHSLLPSLWRVTLESQAEGNALVMLNQGYDAQWQAVSNIWEGIGLNRGIQAKRCDGFASCFVVPMGEKGTTQTIYLFYTPERLSFLGWAMTIFTIGVAWSFFAAHSRKHS